MVKVTNDVPTRVLSFVRQNEKDKVFAVLNFSAQPQTVTFQEDLHHGRYVDYFAGSPVELTALSRLTLEPWGYRVFVR
jgi:maltogenic amylase-like protein